MAKVLFVDDSEKVCLLYRQEFEGDGHEVLVAHDFAEAARLARCERPDVVVAEVLPDQDCKALLGMLQDGLAESSMLLAINTRYKCLGSHPLLRVASAMVRKSADLRALRGAVRRLSAKTCSEVRSGESRKESVQQVQHVHVRGKCNGRSARHEGA